MSARGVQRLFFSFAALGLLALGAVFLVAFATPDRPFDASPVDFGPAEAFERGSVLTFVVGEGGYTEAPPGEVVGVGPAEGCPRMAAVVVHLVRFEDGSFAALSARSSHLGEMVPWLPDFTFEGITGWFREPCHGDTYALDGTRVFGPAPRGLGRYAVEVDDDGHVVVDLGVLDEGTRSSTPRVPGTPTPAATP